MTGYDPTAYRRYFEHEFTYLAAMANGLFDTPAATI